MSLYAMKHDMCPTCRCTDPIPSPADPAVILAAALELPGVKALMEAADRAVEKYHNGTGADWKPWFDDLSAALATLKPAAKGGFTQPGIVATLRPDHNTREDTMIPILKHLPAPDLTKPVPPTNQIYPFETMEEGDSFFAPGRKLRSMATLASGRSKAFPGRKFRARAAVMKPDEKLHWVPAELGEPGAVEGVTIYRIA